MNACDNIRSKSQSKSSGSTMIFVIVGIILTISLIGAVYILKQRGEQVRKEQAIATYDKQQASQKNTDNAAKSSSVVNSGDSGLAADSSSETPKTSQELPTTGPTSIIEELLGAGLLSMAIAYYLLSRRNLTRSL